MKCPECGSFETHVLDSRSMACGTFRKRRFECSACGERFNTLETYMASFDHLTPPAVGSREACHG